MNLFYFSWTGNKRTEVKHIQEYLKNTEYKTLVEPFCGSCAVSLHNSIRNEIKCKYVVNDFDTQLIDFLKHIQENGSEKIMNYLKDTWGEKGDKMTKEDHKKEIDNYKKSPNVYNFSFYHKINNFRLTLYPQKRKIFNLDHTKYKKTDDFFKTATITSVDFRECMNKYKDDPDAFLFLDPPYLDSANYEYSRYTCTKPSEEIQDHTEMYVFIIDFLKSCKCKVLMIMNSNALVRYIYKGYTGIEYSKIYGKSKRKTNHIVITNISNHVQE